MIRRIGDRVVQGVRVAGAGVRAGVPAYLSAPATPHLDPCAALLSRRAIHTGALQPFHVAAPVNDLEAARRFYGGVLGLQEGRSAATWIDWNFGGHQYVTHLVPASSSGATISEHYKKMDADMVPVPHFGICLTVPQFTALAAKVQKAGVTFLVEPHIRFVGKPGEQWTMFFKDPAGNNLEFKAMTNPGNLFAKYYVD